MSPLVSALTNGANPANIAFPQLGGVTVRAGILINDVAIDPDTGDAYFSDSPNCREAFACGHNCQLIT
jgi:hypothetical protein